MTEYNGWTNYETWACALWLSNEQGTELLIAYRSRALDNVYDLAKSIRYLVEKSNPLASDNSMYADLLGAALHEINFREIAEHYHADNFIPDEPEEAAAATDDSADNSPDYWSILCLTDNDSDYWYEYDNNTYSRD